MVAVPHGSHPDICPVRVMVAYREQLAARGITTGPLIRGTTKHDTPRSTGVAPKTINDIV